MFLKIIWGLRWNYLFLKEIYICLCQRLEETARSTLIQFQRMQWFEAVFECAGLGLLLGQLLLLGCSLPLESLDSKTLSLHKTITSPDQPWSAAAAAAKPLKFLFGFPSLEGIPWAEEPGRLQSMGSWRVGHDWMTSLSLYDPADVGNLISSSSAFSKSSLYMWKFSVQVMLKPSLKDFEHNLANMWNEHSCMVVWTFSGIALLWD